MVVQFSLSSRLLVVKSLPPFLFDSVCVEVDDAAPKPCCVLDGMRSHYPTMSVLRDEALYEICLIERALMQTCRHTDLSEKQISRR